ncbi:MAG: hypothetical protein AD073_000255 [Mycoplasmataceae bacterium]|nr:MAG: hypothetical protein AD073_000255 [Mycoplasmataceae bacterium]
MQYLKFQYDFHQYLLREIYSTLLSNKTHWEFKNNVPVLLNLSSLYFLIKSLFSASNWIIFAERISLLLISLNKTLFRLFNLLLRIATWIFLNDSRKFLLTNSDLNSSFLLFNLAFSDFFKSISLHNISVF